MYKMFYCLFMLLWGLQLDEAKSKDAHSYVEIGGDFRVVIVPEDSQIIEIPNSTSGEFCGENDEFYCFEHEDYWFSAPKSKALKKGSKWEKNGRYCEVFSSAKSIRLLSNDEPLFNIHCYNKDKSNKDTDRKLLGVFLYSETRGLLMMEYTLPDTGGKTVSYITTDLKGFGSTP
ncbi:MAG: hypothetical protein OQK51_13085 [Kangiellaceae bacterium]|nr:hypothetical protein [Kangiellaceae bacterium]